MTPRRRIWSIPGGIHPPQHKTESNQSEIQQGHMPSELVLPLQLHLGAAANPIVNIGDQVKKGEVIAQAQGYVSCPIHAPTSGTIKAVEPRPVQHPSFSDSECIVIAPDNKDEWIPLTTTPEFWTQPAENILNLIQQSGIAGLGGAGFPSHVKLNPSKEFAIQTLLLNGVECEPYITADDRLMRERAEAIIVGAFIMAYLVEPKEILIAIEDNKPEAIEAVNQAIQQLNETWLNSSQPFSDIELAVVVVPTKYPSGGEKQLIQIVTGKEVRSGSIPADVGIVCQNIGTAYAVEQAVVHGKPLISRITTFTGQSLYKPGNYEVLIGTPINEMYDQCAVREHRVARLIMGGPMMGFTIHNDASPVLKTTNCIIAATEDEFPAPMAEQPCIRCGACADVCPANLLPQQLFWHAKSQNFDQAQHHNLFDCIECGACSYVCPSHIPLVQYYRYAKGKIKTIEIENQKANHSRERFEARQARLEREEAERAAKRAERQKKAAKAKAAKKPIPKEVATQQANNNIESKTDTAPSKDVTVKQLESKFHRAEKNWKDATKALEQKLKAQNETASDEQETSEDPLAKDRARVKRLKDKVDQAKQAWESALDESSSAPPSEEPALSPKELAIAAAQARVAVKKLSKSVENATDPAKQTQLQKELDEAQTSLQTIESQLAQATSEIKETNPTS